MTQTKVEAPFVENNAHFKNLIINGDFKTWQRATAATAFSSGNYTTADRWKNLISTDGVLKSERYSMSLSDQATTGQGYAYKVTVTTADTSIGASQYALIHQPIEAQNLQHLKYGTSSAETLTLSFWAKATTQESTPSDAKFSVTLNKPDSTAYFLTKEYSFDAHDTWQKFEITFSPTEGSTTLITNSAGAIANDTGVGLHLYFAFGNGSNFTGTANTWTSDGDYASSNQHNLLANTSNNWFVTGVQLEVGDKATDFEHLPFDVQLQRCLRYFFRDNLYTSGVGATGAIAAGQCNTTTRFDGQYDFPVLMRARPTGSVSGADKFRVQHAGSVTATTGISLEADGVAPSFKSTMIYATVSSGLTAGRAGNLIHNNATAHIDNDAEL